NRRNFMGRRIAQDAVKFKMDPRRPSILFLLFCSPARARAGAGQREGLRFAKRPATVCLRPATGTVGSDGSIPRTTLSERPTKGIMQPIHTFNVVPKLPPALEPIL